MKVRQILLATFLASGLGACGNYKPEPQQSQFSNGAGVDTLSLERNINAYCKEAAPFIGNGVDSVEAENFCKKEHWIKSMDSIRLEHLKENIELYCNEAVPYTVNGADGQRTKELCIKERLNKSKDSIRLEQKAILAGKNGYEQGKKFILDSLRLDSLKKAGKIVF